MLRRPSDVAIAIGRPRSCSAAERGADRAERLQRAVATVDVDQPDDVDRQVPVAAARHELIDHPLDDLIDRLDGRRAVRDETVVLDTQGRAQSGDERRVANPERDLVDDPREERDPAGVEVDERAVLVERDPTYWAQHLDQPLVGATAVHPREPSATSRPAASRSSSTHTGWWSEPGASSSIPAPTTDGARPGVTNT